MSEGPGGSATSVRKSDTLPRDRAFFGQPLGLFTLFGTELWERFSYYGMRAILLYYLTDTVAHGGLGIEETSGEALVAIYGSSVYLLSVLGGWLADRVIGARRSVLYGGIVIAAGHDRAALHALADQALVFSQDAPPLKCDFTAEPAAGVAFPG